MRTNRIRHLLVALVAVFAFGAVAAGGAQAFNHPKWHKAGVALAPNPSKVIDASMTSRLWNKELGVVIVCKKDTSKGKIENSGEEGLDTTAVTYEECTPWSTAANADNQIIQKEELTVCKVQDNVEKVAGKIVVPETKSFLAYVPGREPGNATGPGGTEAQVEAVDVFQSKAAEELFVTLEITGASCAVKGTYKIKGSVIGKVARLEREGGPNEEAVMNNVLFETKNEASKVTQRYPKYELNKVATEDVLTFGSNPAALETTEQVELEPNAAVPKGPEPFVVYWK